MKPVLTREKKPAYSGNFEESEKLGKVNERRVAIYLRAECGWGDAPIATDNRITLPDGRVIRAPDLLVFKDKEIRFIEVKGKLHPTYYAKGGGVWQVGFDWKKWVDYRDLNSMNPITVWIFFICEDAETWEEDVKKRDAPIACPTGVYFQSVEVLRKKFDHTWPEENPEMIYWNLGDLNRLCLLGKFYQVLAREGAL